VDGHAGGDGLKTKSEKFAGALRTYGCEAMMQDNKALQAGTSHNLGQNFAQGVRAPVPGRSPGAWSTRGTPAGACSTRLVGGLVMTHGDDNGLRTPPAGAHRSCRRADLEER
jgi:prolyl-tRNA synthetase